MTGRLPLFPLGRVLLPTEVLPLHVFEPRYRVLMRELTSTHPPGEFGVVLIERGHEVGGGDERCSVGTVARLLDARVLPDGRWLVAAGGARRFRVDSWMHDDPFPQALVEDIPDQEWDPADAGLLSQAEETVRSAAAVASELGDAGVPAGFELPSDPAASVWVLCALAPVGTLDRQHLLESPTTRDRLELLLRTVREAAELLAFRMGGG